MSAPLPPVVADFGVPMADRVDAQRVGLGLQAGADRLGRRAREGLQQGADLRVAARLLRDGAQEALDVEVEEPDAVLGHLRAHRAQAVGLVEVSPPLASTTAFSPPSVPTTTRWSMSAVAVLSLRSKR